MVGEQAERVGRLLDLDPHRAAVLLVDFQRDFCGPPGTQRNVDTAQHASRFAEAAAQFGVRVIYTQQVLDLTRLTPKQGRWEQSSRLCLAGSPGAEMFVTRVPGSRVVRKDRFDIWQSPEFLAALSEWNIDGVVIGGVELQCCVLYAVLGAQERGYHYVVPQDLVSGLDRCEPTSNRAVRNYLTAAHPAPESSAILLSRWAQAMRAH